MNAKIYNEGYNAYHAKVHIDDNPYRHYPLGNNLPSENCISWEEGWADAYFEVELGPKMAMEALAA